MTQSTPPQTHTLEQVVPWGRSLADYRGMFKLSDRDLQAKILDCGSGPASFNAEVTAIGGSVISCDPIYQYSVAQIQQRITETYPVIVETLHKTADRFVWTTYQTPEHLGEVRLATMQNFLADFPTGLAAQRYQNQLLPTLNFADRQFDLALCGHLLFTYSEQLDLAFHHAAIAELLRVAAEVRIFPLLVNFTTARSPHLDPVMTTLEAQGYQVTIETVAYEFQRGGNEMLRIRKV